ncbi:MAG: ribosomal RNA small subunit methyltransferase E [Candidatus Hepatoplasma vulgare]|nr:MAG: ribosomal RNA small subunit methyltransferase E [Candidatus Hepatoplasma sp.]
MKHRFFIEDKEFDNKEFIPNINLKKQIKKVLRIKKSETFLVINKEKEYLAYFEDDKIKILKLIREKEKEKKIKIYLIQSLVNHSIQKIILQKSTELGIDGIYFFESKFSNYKIKDEKNKYKRHFQILKEAAEQSNQLKIPFLNYLNNLDELSFSKKDLLLFAYEKEEDIYLKSFLDKNNFYKRIFIVIGPEGGFSLEEINKFKKMNFNIVKLTDTILRTETAVIYSISIFNYLFIK